MGLKLNGATSGSVELDVPAAIGSDIEFTLPGADGSAGQVLATNGAGVLSFTNRLEWDHFFLNAAQTSDGDITDWSRVSTTGVGLFGDQMSVTSGIFSFPNTGYYLVIARPTFDVTPDDTVIMRTYATTDNGSNFNQINWASDGNSGGSSTARHGSSVSFSFVDVTDTSQVKVKFYLSSVSTGSALMGDTVSRYLTQAIFIRLGDT